MYYPFIICRNAAHYRDRDAAMDVTEIAKANKICRNGGRIAKGDRA